MVPDCEYLRTLDGLPDKTCWIFPAIHVAAANRVAGRKSVKALALGDLMRLSVSLGGCSDRVSAKRKISLDLLTKAGLLDYPMKDYTLVHARGHRIYCNSLFLFQEDAGLTLRKTEKYRKYRCDVDSDMSTKAQRVAWVGRRVAEHLRDTGWRWFVRSVRVMESKLPSRRFCTSMVAASMADELSHINGTSH